MTTHFIISLVNYQNLCVRYVHVAPGEMTKTSMCTAFFIDCSVLGSRE